MTLVMLITLVVNGAFALLMRLLGPVPLPVRSPVVLPAAPGVALAVPLGPGSDVVWAADELTIVLPACVAGLIVARYWTCTCAPALMRVTVPVRLLPENDAVT